MSDQSLDVFAYKALKTSKLKKMESSKELPGNLYCVKLFGFWHPI